MKRRGLSDRHRYRLFLLILLLAVPGTFWLGWQAWVAMVHWLGACS